VVISLTVLLIAATVNSPVAHGLGGSTAKPAHPGLHSVSKQALERMLNANASDLERNRLQARRKAAVRPLAGRRFPARRIAAGLAGAVVGVFAGAAIGEAMDSPCDCDSPGLAGALIGVPIGATLGAIIGALAVR
jgi:hypothetical protein